MKKEAVIIIFSSLCMKKHKLSKKETKHKHKKQDAKAKRQHCDSGVLSIRQVQGKL